MSNSHVLVGLIIIKQVNISVTLGVSAQIVLTAGHHKSSEFILNPESIVTLFSLGNESPEFHITIKVILQE